MNSRDVAERVAKRLTKRVALRWGATFPFYYVAEYPKSGGTWLARMVADYLRAPFPQAYVVPLGFRAVIRHEWGYDDRYRDPIYLYRDGRDVMVSLFYDRIRTARHSNRPGSRRVADTYRKALGEYEAEDIVKLLPRFIEFEMENPGRGARSSWRDHTMDWHGSGGRPGVTYVSYEELRSDCQTALGRVISSVTGEAVMADRIADTVERFSMESMTGRKPGEADITSHIRRGLPGEWKTVFTRHAADVFNRTAGDALVALGYETDLDWVDRHSFVEAT